MPPYMLGPVQHVLAYERQIAEAAVTGDQDTVRRALLTHPLVAEWHVVEELWPILREGSAKYLPEPLARTV